MPKKPASSGRPRVSQAEATRRLVDATVKLAGSRLMSEISVGMIADEVGLRSGSVLVKRYFGFRKDLLQAAAPQLTEQNVELLEHPQAKLSDNPTVNAFIIGGPTHGLLRKRFALITELVDEKMDPTAAQQDSMRIINAMANNYHKVGISERTAFVTACKAYGLLYMQHALYGVIGLTKEHLDDLMSLTMFELGNAQEIEKQLGWV
jgi:AcrR family transcriptional regulator